MASPDYPYYFDHGLDAYSEENYFEAYTSIYHCWELFISTFVKTILLISNNGSIEEVDAYLKPIKNNSVQLEAAFHVLYAQYFHQKPPIMNGKQKQLRNRIIHGVRNPEKTDVESCINDVYQFIKLTELRLLITDDSTREKHIGSSLILYSNAQLARLRKNGTLNQEDLDSGRSLLFEEGQRILGRTFTTSSPQTTMTVLTFGEMIIERKRMKKMEDMLAAMNH